MAELGPFNLSAESMANVSKDGVPALWPNPYSWDTRANVLILEHPPGTGLSLGCRQTDCLTDPRHHLAESVV